MKSLNKEVGNIGLVLGFVVCIAIGYYFGVSHSFSAVSEVYNH